jgi:hypothetical protein
MRRVITVAVLLVAIWAVLPPLAQAQTRCQEFRALSQWTAGPHPFSGPMYALFGGEMLIDDNAHWVEFAQETCNGATCQGTGGKLLLNFGNGDTFTLTVQHGVYVPAYTTVPGFGTWRATMRIVAGTGRFASATGLIVSTGPWAVWIDQTGFHARFSGELTGMICNSLPGQPKP